MHNLETSREVLDDFLSMFAKCGICEKEGGENYWSSPDSAVAHGRCIEAIAETEQPLSDLLKKYLHDHDTKAVNIAHMDVIENIKKHLEGKTILEYKEQYGENKLKEIFDMCSKELFPEYYKQ